MIPKPADTPTRLLRDRQVDLTKHFPTRCLAMREVLARLARYVNTNLPIVLLGEPGTGKTMLAQAIHNASRRREQELVYLNLADLDEHLFRSEAFGYVKGAFTGAMEDRAGAFERADKGTLFLDDFYEMTRAAQGHLLPALDYKQFQRVGSAKVITSDCRYIYATNRRLEEVRDNPERWRLDLHARMGMCIFKVPSLRERIEDLPDLTDRYVRDACLTQGRTQTPKVADQTRRALAERTYTANLRELRATLEAAIPMCDGDLLLPEHLPSPVELALSKASVRPMWQVDVEAIHRAIAACAGNKREAARLLEISHTCLYDKLAEANDRQMGRSVDQIA